MLKTTSTRRRPACRTHSSSFHPVHGLTPARMTQPVCRSPTGLQANSSALVQSSSNASAGVGFLQVADGALSQVTNLLNRAVTLATEAGGGTLSGSAAERSQPGVSGHPDSDWHHRQHHELQRHSGVHVGHRRGHQPERVGRRRHPLQHAGGGRGPHHRADARRYAERLDHDQVQLRARIRGPRS